ncbi:hypothetical protein RD792_015539 [Penstemon davidsonii]|uniref:Uncharacterized protein n=1 Tax=Penstemon davidsonii TaxID=160366 RepID=A0ABR0CH24_9LAMI|nr:hypothetical protein RD792_015539 [Penstemon davidsonii]
MDSILQHAYRDGRLEEVAPRHLGAEDGNTVIAKSIRLSDFLRNLQISNYILSLIRVSSFPYNLINFPLLNFGQIIVLCIMLADLNPLEIFTESSSITTMEMKKIACATIIAAAATMSAVSATASGPSQAPAPAPVSGAFAALPAVGSLIGASLLSFFALYMH